eukprot:g37895.t1
MWGDSTISARQLVKHGNLDYLVGDYLAEVTMAILARKKAADPEEGGFANDWVSTLAPLLVEIKAKGIKVITNAGGLNPTACQRALLKAAAKQGLTLKVAVVLGDDLLDRAGELRRAGLRDMWTQTLFPPEEDVLSVNCYLGARPIALALARGAEVVITGRAVDSCMCLGPLLYEHGWSGTDWDRLSAGSLVGHVLECGAQGTGGLFTDWQQAAPGWHNMGYPIAEVAEDGTFIVTKAQRTGGAVVPAAVAEQIVYEIGDPAAYLLPDVSCDWTAVHVETAGSNRVKVWGARGRPPPDALKVCTTYRNGYKLVLLFGIVGQDAKAKAEATAKALLTRTQKLLQEQGLANFSEHSLEVLGAEHHYGPHADAQRTQTREVVARVALRHQDPRALRIFAKELASATVSMAPGTMGFTGRVSPIPVISLHSTLLPQSKVQVTVSTNFRGNFPVPPLALVAPLPGKNAIAHSAARPVDELTVSSSEPVARVPLLTVCYARSGDKGPAVNIGVIARRPEYLPYLRKQLTAQAVQAHFSYRNRGAVTRFDLPPPLADLPV